MAAKFVPNPAGIAAVGPMLEPTVARMTRQVLETAVDIAPVDEEDFRNSLKMEMGWTLRGPWLLPRGRVYSDDPGGRHIEFGTSDTPIHGTLRRASDTARA